MPIEADIEQVESDNLPNDHMRVMNFVDGRCSFNNEQGISDEADVCRNIIAEGPYLPEEVRTLNTDIDVAYEMYLLSLPMVPQWKIFNLFNRKQL